MNPTGNFFYDVTNNSYYPQYMIQNFGCNFNLVQPNPFNQSQSNYTRPEYPYSNLNQSSLGFDINSQYKVTQRQPLQCIFDSNSQNILNQNYFKNEPVSGYSNANMSYPFSKGIPYENIMKIDPDNNNNNFDPFLMLPPGSLLPTVDTPDQKPCRQTHENCTTYKYNRKSSNSTSPRKFKCSFLGCNKAYLKNSHLKAHVRIHSGEKPHVCKFIFPDGTNCTESFIRSDQLTRHRRRHENDKPFQCEQCHKQFFRSDHCRTHQERCRMKQESNIFSF